MANLVDPQEDLQNYLERTAPKVADALLSLAPWIARRIQEGKPPLDSELRAHPEFKILQRLLGQDMILADVLGRRRLLLEVAEAKRPEGRNFAGGPLVSPFVPAVRFEEAVEDVTSRYPTIAQGYEKVQELYRERHAFAVARSATLELTQKVRDEIDKGLNFGRTSFETVKAIEKVVKGEDDPYVTAGKWTRAYVQTVHRTNAATAYTAGRFQQANDPDVEAVIGALEYSTAGDSAVRDTHAMLDGVIMAQNDPRWDFIAPPLGYNCRCALRLVTRDELQEKGLIQNGQVVPHLSDWDGTTAPDPDFRSQRPDRQIYG